MEVCVDSVMSAINADKGGASRIELCSALNEGGLTPTPGFVQVVKSAVSIPVFVMIRPRSGNDFNYSHQEVQIMKKDIHVLKDAGADGFVFGALTPNFTIDTETCSKLMKRVGRHPATFHRAFDVSSGHPLDTMETIIKLGFSRILTSGQQPSAGAGVSLIKEMIEAAKGRIIIMPGGGIRVDNLRYILEQTGAREFHGSAKTFITLNRSEDGESQPLEGTSQSSRAADICLSVTDEEQVRQMLEIYTSLKKFRVK